MTAKVYGFKDVTGAYGLVTTTGDREPINVMLTYRDSSDGKWYRVEAEGWRTPLADEHVEATFGPAQHMEVTTHVEP